MAVQQLIKNAKYGNKGFLPELKVIKNGILTGFIIINPRWAGFNVKDYLNVAEKTEITEENAIETMIYKINSKNKKTDKKQESEETEQ